MQVLYNVLQNILLGKKTKTDLQQAQVKYLIDKLYDPKASLLDLLKWCFWQSCKLNSLHKLHSMLSCQQFYTIYKAIHKLPTISRHNNFTSSQTISQQPTINFMTNQQFHILLTISQETNNFTSGQTSNLLYKLHKNNITNWIITHYIIQSI